MVDIVGPTTFGDAWDTAVRLSGDRPFLVFLASDGSRRTYSYRQFDALVSDMAAALAGCGIGLGSIVALQLPNSPEFLLCLLGLAKLGAIAAPLATAARPTELRGYYRTSGAEWAVVEADRADLHLALRASDGLLPGGLLGVHGQHRGVPSLEQLAAAQDGSTPARPDIGSDAVAELLFTSGTTAGPKAVMITHANLVFSGHYALWQTSLRSDDRIFTAMPACHSNFQLVALTGAIVAGACLVLSEKYSAHRFWADVRAERATVVQLMAMMARTLLWQPPDPADARHQVRQTLSFMPLDDHDKQEFESRFGVRLTNSYGLTESIGWAVTDPPQGERRWPSVGRAGLAYTVAVKDPAGQVVPPGETGELCIQGVPGRTLMAGYWGDAAATAAALADGWLRTGDIGYCDQDGWFYFVDRAANIIKRAGENISASELELVLTAHPLIAQAAVIGVPDPIRDQAVKAFVQLVPGATASEMDVSQAGLQRYCGQHLAPHKVPQIIDFVAELPCTESLKIEKRGLR
jgi:crotonobetaine/carnitine-CoA ligase